MSRRVSRRVTAALGATALLAVALPAMPALASAASSAELAALDTEVLPGGTNVFDVTVRNGEASTLLSSGRTINAIRVILPSEIGVRTTTDPVSVPGWEVRRTSSTTTGLERYDLKPASGNAGLAPGATLALPLPASVARPFSGDRSAAFQVAVSSDAGNTFQTSTGALSTTIRTLKVASVTVVDDTVDNVKQNVADGNATAGQRILTQVKVENYATSAQTVTAALRSEGGTTPSDSVGTATPASVDGFSSAPGSTVFTVPVTLGQVTVDTLRTFTGTATSERSAATTPRFVSVLGGYAVQAAPTLNLAGFRPAAGNGNSNVDFVVDATKLGTPTLVLPSSSSLVLRSRADGTRTSAPITLKDAESFGAGTVTQPAEFVSTLLDKKALVDGRYDAVFTLGGVDGNGAPLLPAQRSKTLADVFNFDNLVPTVDINIQLPTDLDGDRTTAARNFDGSNAITVTARGTDSGGAPDLNKVVLACELGAASEYLPAGTPTESVSGNTRTVTATFQVADFGACREFEAKAVFKDAAGNVEDEVTSRITVDNLVPSLDTKTRGLTGAVGRYDGVDAAKSSIMVNIDDNVLSADAATTGVIGGCDPRAYAVDGQLLVQGVYVLENGSFRECTVGLGNTRAAAKPANNARYLRLTSDISRDATEAAPTVTYTARSGIGSDRVKDAAGNYATNAIQDTVNRLVPDAPVLLTVKRAARAEDAYNDGKAFYTRFFGNDLKVTVTGGLDGDVLQLLDANGTQIGGDISTLDGGGEVAVPVARTEGVQQVFGLRFKSPAQVLGKVTDLRVVFDETLPTALSTARGANNTATVTFKESVIGSNAAINWNVFEIVEDEQGQPARAFRGVSSVAGSGAERTITADFTANPYGGALYEYLENVQYEDFAGNDLAPSTLVLK